MRDGFVRSLLRSENLAQLDFRSPMVELGIKRDKDRLTIKLEFFSDRSQRLGNCIRVRQLGLVESRISKTLTGSTEERE
jgi:hypothetical protein